MCMRRQPKVSIVARWFRACRRPRRRHQTQTLSKLPEIIAAAGQHVRVRLLSPPSASFTPAYKGTQAFVQW